MTLLDEQQRQEFQRLPNPSLTKIRQSKISMEEYNSLFAREANNKNKLPSLIYPMGMGKKDVETMIELSK